LSKEIGELEDGGKTLPSFRDPSPGQKKRLRSLTDVSSAGEHVANSRFEPAGPDDGKKNVRKNKDQKDHGSFIQPKGAPTGCQRKTGKTVHLISDKHNTEERTS